MTHCAQGYGCAECARELAGAKILKRIANATGWRPANGSTSEIRISSRPICPRELRRGARLASHVFDMGDRPSRDADRRRAPDILSEGENTSRALIVALAASLVSSCAGATVGISVSPRMFSSGRNDLGIPPCGPAASTDPLSPAALECWFAAAHGRWRTISHDDHDTELVVHVQTVDLDDAREIAQTFVVAENERFTEISVYVQKEGARADSPTRRVTWTRDGGFAVMDFRGDAPRR